uniref:Secreted protein n=1 Tax=Heterorhabditis bacteriophora TaxID=37862 RepID=A0A1I7WQ41_HETBA
MPPYLYIHLFAVTHSCPLLISSHPISYTMLYPYISYDTEDCTLLINRILRKHSIEVGTLAITKHCFSNVELRLSLRFLPYLLAIH